MVGKKSQSALLAKYYGMYKKNSRSRVFAPLAEAYRKLGMLEEAYKILKDGIRNHPDYVLGYIVLAHCYYDEKKYELTYNTLRPIISKNADNISLQKIFAHACINLGHLEEALDTFKYLLFLSPKDKYFAEQVKKLEDDLLVGHKKLTLDQIVKAPNLPELKQTSQASFDDDWVQVDFNKPTIGSEEEKLLPDEVNSEKSSDENLWVMKKPTLQEHPILNDEKIPERSLEDDFYADEFADEGDIDEINDSVITPDAPIISHTLIDLYCGQHYYDKAIELLNKILELNPKDEPTLKKLESVKQLKATYIHSGGESSEDAGHNELISIIENQVKLKSADHDKVQLAFGKFLDMVKEKALTYR